MSDERIVMLLDMDCFYVQVEQRDAPHTKGLPCAVAQYNGETGGGYEARDKGVKRGTWGKTARQQFPELILFEVPEKRDKADLTKYRSAGAEVIDCIASFFPSVERASIDEAYVDMTDVISQTCTDRDNLPDLLDLAVNSESFVVSGQLASSEQDDDGAESVKKLCTSLDSRQGLDKLLQMSLLGEKWAVASGMVYRLRQAILTKTGFKCSAGIAPNKTLAKLACSLNKPNKQTVVPMESSTALLQATPLQKIRNLGGKLGKALIERFHVETLAQVTGIPFEDLSREFGERTALWLTNLCQGRDSEQVVSRSLPQSIGCSKNFVGRSLLVKAEQVKDWLGNLATELIDRVETDAASNQRRPNRVTLYVKLTPASSTEQPQDHQTLTASSTAGVSLSRVISPNGSVLAPLWSSSRSSGSTSTSSTGTMMHQAVINRISELALAALNDVLSANGSQQKLGEIGVTCLGLAAGKFASTKLKDTADIRDLFCKQPPLSTPQQSAREQQDETSPVFDCQASEKGDGRVSSTHSPSSSSSTVAVSKTTNDQVTSPMQSSSDQHHPIITDTLPTTTPNSNKSNKAGGGSAFYLLPSSDWTVCCDECGSRVAIDALEEHKDFHLAQRVQSDWMAESGSPVVSRTISGSSSATTKCGRGKRRSAATKSLSKQPRRGGLLDRFLVKPDSDKS